MIKDGLQSRAAYIFYFFTVLQDINHAQSFLGCVFFEQALFTFYSLQHHVHIRHRRDSDQQKAVVVV